MLKQTTDEPIDGFEADVHVTAGGLFRRIYAFFHNKKVGLALILATGLLGLIGALAKQMPDSVRLDPGSRAAWLEQVRPIYGGWTNVVDSIGIFHIFSSPLFLTVCILLALSIIACTTHRLPLLYQKAYKPHRRVRPSFFDHAKLSGEFTSDLSPDEAKAAVVATLAREKQRALGDDDMIYADRFHWAPFGTAAAHLGYVVVMAGFLVSSFAGFRIDNFELTIGMPKDVGHGTGLTAEAHSFVDTYDAEWGTPIDYVTDLSVTRDGEEIDRHDVRVNEPLIIDGIYFHQASFGVSAVIDVRDADGAELFRGGVPLSWRTPDQQGQYGVAALEDKDLEVFVIASASGAQGGQIDAGQVQVEVYPAGGEAPLGRALVDAGSETQVADLTVGFEREQKYTSMIVKRDPGSIVVWIGCALLIVGTILTMGLPHRRQWIRITPDGEGSRIQMASPDKPDSARRRLFDQLMTSLETAAGRRDGKA